MSDAIDLQVAGAELAAQRRALVSLWVAVTEAGGAVGFRPPVDAATVTPAVEELLRELAAGTSAAIVARDGHGAIIGLVVVTPGRSPRRAHVVTLRRLMVHPHREGEGLGARLVGAAHRLAVDRYAAELALVEVRDGTGVERFYGRLGYRSIGTIPGGLAFEDGDRVDELLLLRELR